MRPRARRFRLTSRGFSAAAVTALLVAAGRGFGIFELTALGAALGAVLIGSSLSLLIPATGEIYVRRQLENGPVHAGDVCRVTLSVHNGRNRASPVLLVRDHVDGGSRRVVSWVAPVHPHGEQSASYRLPVLVRGMTRIGPLELLRTDPLGFFERRIAHGADSELRVYPAVAEVELGPLRRAAGPALPAWRAPHRQMDSEDGAIREYTPGDDLRRVHWPLSARSGSLLVREPEHRGGHELAVLLDMHDASLAGAPFELAVSVAASFVEAAARAHVPCELVLSDGTRARGERAALDVLLTVEPGGSSPRAWPALGVSTSDAVLVTGTAVLDATGLTVDLDRLDVVRAGGPVAGAGGDRLAELADLPGRWSLLRERR